METTTENSVTALKEEERSITWETNHQKIVSAITDTIKGFRPALPTVTEIAENTGLSRQTIYHHLKEYSTAAAYKKCADMFGILQLDVMMRLVSLALCGDIKAMRLYLEMTGALKKENKVSQNFISNSNNLQINGMVLNSEVINKLNPEQLKKIEEIISPVMEPETIVVKEDC